MTLTPLQKLLSNVGDLGKIIVATGFEWLHKVQKVAQSGHTAHATYQGTPIKARFYCILQIHRKALQNCPQLGSLLRRHR